MSTPTIIEFVTDPQFLGLSVSPAQETLLRAIYGLELDSEQLDIWGLCAGGRAYPGRPFSEATIIAGGRSGKDSRIASPIGIYEAIFGDHEKELGRGERAVVPIIAQDMRGTRVAFTYTRDYLLDSPLLADEVDRVLASEIRLRNGINIVSFPCRAAAMRGWSIPVGVLDEVGFFRLEGSVESDVEIQAAVRRGMLAFKSPKLVKISTPYMKGGLLYDDFKASYGKDDPHRLVWKAPTALMNPSIRVSALDRERDLDPSRFSREYEAEFSEDLDAFLPTAWIEAAVVLGRHELPPSEGFIYVVAIDSSGAGADTFTVSIGHAEQRDDTQVVVQDLLRGWKKSRGATLDLEGVVSEIARVIKPYGVRRVLSDRYAAGWVQQAVERNGLVYVVAPSKSEAYLAIEPLFAAGRIEILDHEQQRRQFMTLERQLKPGGRTKVDHARGCHDDYANVLALVAAELVESSQRRGPRMFHALTGREIHPNEFDRPYDLRRLYT